MKKTLLLAACSAVLLSGPSNTYGQIINTVAGNGTPGFSGDGNISILAELNVPTGIAVDQAGNGYIADYGNNRIRKIDRTTGVITTIAGTGLGTFSGDGGQAVSATIHSPKSIAVDNQGNVYFTDNGNNRIRRIDNSTGIITTIAGNADGQSMYSGDGGLADTSHIGYPWGLAVDNNNGDIYFADQNNNRVRKIDAAGIMHSVAGNGVSVFGGDGGQATAASMQTPTGVALDMAGNLYIADYGDNRIRKVNTSGIISTVAGSAVFGFSGDGGPSTASRLYYPEAVAVDRAGNIYICDVNNNRIRKINAAGIISTITGNGVMAYSGDGGPVVNAQINQATGVAVDTAGNLYIADKDNNRIRATSFPIHAPSFVKGRNTILTVCQGESFVDSLLGVYDLDLGQTETWSVITAPVNGTTAIGYTTTSTGAVMNTAGQKYISNPGFSGADSFKVIVSDGTLSDTTMIHVNVIVSPTPVAISGKDSLCAGGAHSITLSDSPAGGVWSVFSTTIATVDPATGVVTGILPNNHDTVYYTITNMCGTGSAALRIYVRAANVCATGVNATVNNVTGIELFPNPTNTGTMTINMAADVNEEVHYAITDLTGKMVKEFTNVTNKPVDITLNEPSGIYLVSAITAHGKWIEKITIIK